MRLHLFEFEDQPWFPEVIRSGGTDYLRYFLNYTELYRPCIPLIADTLKTIHEDRILDLCSGGGGYIESLSEGLDPNISILLSDKFPNLAAFELLKEKSSGRIDYTSQAVDATDVSESMHGFRTLFSAIHHFKPQQVKAIIQNATNHRVAIGIFDGGEKSLWAILGLIIIHPIVFFLFSPFFKPFKFSRLFFTYLFPLIPLYTIWDGCVSILRMYTPDQLVEIAHSIDPVGYEWKHGKTMNRFGIKATFLIGYPKKELSTQ